MKIIEIAKTYIGKKEKPGNSGFEDPEFEKEMIARGWEKGFSWCAVFAELMFSKAYPDDLTMLKLFNPGAVKTFENFKGAGYNISNKPELGNLVIWQHYENGKALWTGHAGIVSEVLNTSTFRSIEGNGSVAGSRNGDRVVEKLRIVIMKKTGLNIKGFIIIPK